jgi:hypothetical protein
VVSFSGGGFTASGTSGGNEIFAVAAASVPARLFDIGGAFVSSAVSVSAGAFETSRGFVATPVSVNWECASCGGKRQSAARIARQLRPKLRAHFRGATTDSKTGLKDKSSPGKLLWIGQALAIKNEPTGATNIA